MELWIPTPTIAKLVPSHHLPGPISHRATYICVRKMTVSSEKATETPSPMSRFSRSVATKVITQISCKRSVKYECWKRSQLVPDLDYVGMKFTSYRSLAIRAKADTTSQFPHTFPLIHKDARAPTSSLSALRMSSLLKTHQGCYKQRWA